jgi:chromosome segregation ATPase
MTRTKAILSAAAITSTVLLAILAISVINMIADGTISINVPASTETAQLDQLDQRQAALDQAQGVMGDRQTDYALEIATAQRRVADLQASIDRQRAQNAADKATVEDLKGQLSVVNGSVAQLQVEANAWHQKEADYSAQIAAANEQILALQAQIDQLAGQ